MKSFRAAVRLLLGATIGLVVIGVIVRATDSGMGCPDWPLCYGQLIPPTTDSGDVIAYKAWLEWIHRAIAAMIGLIVLAVVALALRNLKDRRSLQGPRSPSSGSCSSRLGSDARPCLNRTQGRL